MTAPRLSSSTLAEALTPYRALCGQVDLLCARIAGDYAAALSCRAGCAGCCTLQGVLPVEAASLYLAWRSLAAGPRHRLRQRLAEHASGSVCPLLDGGLCPLYAARPIICRTHGLPLLIEDSAGRRIDRCPLNFSGYPSLPGTAVITLERLNTALVTINRQFVTRLFAGGGVPERVLLRDLLTIARAGT